MNEELKSTNEELETMNDEQRRHAEELDRLNIFLEAILGNLGVGVAVVDREQPGPDLEPNAQDLWGLRPTRSRASNLSRSTSGCPSTELREPLEDAISAGRRGPTCPWTRSTGAAGRCAARCG